MGLGAYYEVFENIIKGVNGTEIIFSGLADQTVESIKSYEGVDICWVEEGQVVRKKSWDILVPTIRKAGSEIWVSFNPDLETDETYQRFVVHQPHDCVSEEINWRDNPWWSEILENERLDCLERDPDNYDNIWEGKCRPAVEGAIYHKEVVQCTNENRVCNVPYDPLLKVHLVFDLGWSDSMFIGLVQKHVSEIRIIESLHGQHTTLAEWSSELKDKKYNWGKVWLPHDGFTGDLKTGMTSEQIMRKLGWDVAKKDEIAMISVEEGIRAAKLVFPRMYIDKGKNEYLLECLKRYQRRINRQTGLATTPLHNEFSHGADMFRYIAVNAEFMTNDDKAPVAETIMAHVAPLDDVVGI